MNYGQLVASGIKVDGNGLDSDETLFRVDGKSEIDELIVRDRFTFDGDKLIVDSQEVKISTNVKTSTGDIAIGHANNPENILLHGDTGVISLTGDIDFTDDIEIKDGTTTIFKGSSGIQKDREVILYNLKVNSFGSNQGGKIELYDNSVNKVFSVNNAGTMEVAGDATLKKSLSLKSPSDTTIFKVDEVSGNTEIHGSLNVKSQSTTLNGDVTLGRFKFRYHHLKWRFICLWHKLF